MAVPANRFASRPRPDADAVRVQLLRPGAHVELVDSQVPPLQARVAEVSLSAGGYRVLYTCTWWESGRRVSGVFEPAELAHAGGPGELMELTL